MQYVNEELARKIGYVKDGLILALLESIEQMKGTIEYEIDTVERVERAYLDEIGVE